MNLLQSPFLFPCILHNFVFIRDGEMWCNLTAGNPPPPPPRPDRCWSAECSPTGNLDFEI